MALIKCNECGQMVSDKAEMCPNCGYPIGGNDEKDVDVSDNTYDIYRPQDKSNKKWMWIAIAAVAVLFAVIISVSSNSRDRDSYPPSSYETETVASSDETTSSSSSSESVSESTSKPSSGSSNSSSSSSSSSGSFSSDYRSSGSEYFGTYEFTDKLNTAWVLVLNSDKTATIRVKNGSKEAYGSWSYYKTTGYPNIWFMDERPLIWFPSGEERAYHLCIQDNYIYLGDNALEAKNPRKRLEYTKVN